MIIIVRVEKQCQANCYVLIWDSKILMVIIKIRFEFHINVSTAFELPTVIL